MSTVIMTTDASLKHILMYVESVQEVITASDGQKLTKKLLTNYRYVGIQIRIRMLSQSDNFR